MTIVAKYPAACPCCSVPIRAGDKIEWTKGSKARHAHHGAVAAAPTVAPRTMRYARGAGRPAGTIECEECGDYVRPGTRCWETGSTH